MSQFVWYEGEVSEDSEDSHGQGALEPEYVDLLDEETTNLIEILSSDLEEEEDEHEQQPGPAQVAAPKPSQPGTSTLPQPSSAQPDAVQQLPRWRVQAAPDLQHDVQDPAVAHAAPDASTPRKKQRRCSVLDMCGSQLQVYQEEQPTQRDVYNMYIDGSHRPLWPRRTQMSAGGFARCPPSSSQRTAGWFNFSLLLLGGAPGSLRAELGAIYVGCARVLGAIQEQQIDTGSSEVHMHTDCQAAANLLKGKGVRVPPKLLPLTKGIKDLLRRAKGHLPVRLKWVKGHQKGTPTKHGQGNDEAHKHAQPGSLLGVEQLPTGAPGDTVRDEAACKAAWSELLAERSKTRREKAARAGAAMGVRGTQMKRSGRKQQQPQGKPSAAQKAAARQQHHAGAMQQQQQQQQQAAHAGHAPVFLSKADALPAPRSMFAFTQPPPPPAAAAKAQPAAAVHYMLPQPRPMRRAAPAVAGTPTAGSQLAAPQGPLLQPWPPVRSVGAAAGVAGGPPAQAVPQRPGPGPVVIVVPAGQPPPQVVVVSAAFQRQPPAFVPAPPAPPVSPPPPPPPPESPARGASQAGRKRSAPGSPDSVICIDC